MLKNKRIAVTRPKDQQSELIQLLEKQGAIVLSRPIIKIEEMEHKRRIRKIIKLITKKNADIIAFTSSNGVISVLEFAKKINMFDQLKSELNQITIAAIGEKTADKLESEGIKVDLIPKSYTSIDLGKLMIEYGVINKRIFLLRANIATEDLPNLLMEAQATVISFTVYKVVPEKIENIRKIVDEILAGQIDIIIFTSAFAANTLFGYSDRKYYQNLLDYAMEKVKIVAIGPITQKALAGIGFNVEIVAKTYTIEGIVEELIYYYK
ncbi:MAG: uroporphyrinogen-III synthase [Candidatus Helarchaeota archaeon]|nr:uroporphyrinogen-III synthase [Candidatus Helarchaeota archaeon]